MDWAKQTVLVIGGASFIGLATETIEDGTAVNLGTTERLLRYTGHVAEIELRPACRQAR